MMKRRHSAGYMTNWAARLFTRAIDRRLRPLGVSPGHMPVFFALADGGEMSQRALTGRAAVEQPTMAATLKRMEREGLVTRRPDPGDGRATLIALTPEAMEKVRAINAQASAVNAIALAGLGADEQAMFMDMLARVVETLEADLNVEEISE